MEFGGDAQGEGQVQGVVVGGEGTGIGSTGLGLEHRCFDLQEAPIVEPAAHGADDAGAAPEGFPGLGRNNQIEVALAVALFNICQTMPLIGKGLEGLAEHVPVSHLDRKLTAIGTFETAVHTDPIPRIHQGGQLAEYLRVVGIGRLQAGPIQIELDAAAFVGQGEKSQLAHHPTGHHPTRHRHRIGRFLAVGQIGVLNLQAGVAMAGLKTKGIGPLAQGRQFLGFLPAGHRLDRQEGSTPFGCPHRQVVRFFEGIKIQQFGAIRFDAPVTAAADQIRLGHRTEFLDLGEQIGASEHGGLANGGRLPPQLTAAKLPSPIRWEA